MTSPTVQPPAESQSRDQEIVIGLMEELVSHLEDNWEKEQQRQRQRQLNMAVSRGDVDATRKLVALGAEPNYPDSQGLTCLHAAAKFRVLPVAEALIELKGDLTVTDVQGNLPAHHLRLYSQHPTCELCKVLAPSEALLGQRNKAGVSPFMRLAAWAYTAVDSKPYPPGVELIEQLQAKYVSLTANVSAKSCLEDILEKGAVVQKVEEYTVQGRKQQVHIWSSPDGRADVHIFWMGFQLYMPVALQEPALRTIAECVCTRFGARIYASLEPSVATSRGELVSAMRSLFEALPMQDKVFVVDNTMSVGFRLLSEMRSRIKAALIINPLGWFSDDFYGSEAFENMYKVVGGHASYFRDKDIERAGSLVGNMAFLPGDEDTTKRLMKVYSEGMTSASDSWFRAQEYVPQLLCREATPDLKSLPEMSDFPISVLCGSHSPAMLVQETAARLQGIIKETSLSWIPNSKQWWEVEGEEQVLTVAQGVASLLKDRK